MHHWSTFVLYVPSAFKIEIRLLDLISTLKHKEVGCVTPPTTARKKATPSAASCRNFH